MDSENSNQLMNSRVLLFPRGCFPLLTALTMLLSQRARALDLLVYNNSDGPAGSLRQAISDNNALGGGNTIVFSNIVTGTITLSGGELLVTRDVNIVGPGDKVLTISGNNASRVFHLTNSTANISGLTIANGSASR